MLEKTRGTMSIFSIARNILPITSREERTTPPIIFDSDATGPMINPKIIPTIKPIEIFQIKGIFFPLSLTSVSSLKISNKHKNKNTYSNIILTQNTSRFYINAKI